MTVPCVWISPLCLRVTCLNARSRIFVSVGHVCDSFLLVLSLGNGFEMSPGFGAEQSTVCDTHLTKCSGFVHIFPVNVCSLTNTATT